MHRSIYSPLILSGFIAACSFQEQETETIANPLPACQEYAQDIKSYSYCVYQLATSFKDVQSVDKYCSQALEWQDACRQAWAVSKVESIPIPDLIEICGKNDDCSLEVLDKKPHNDVLEQLKLCARYGGKFAPDCAMHATQRWYFEWPEADEVARVSKEQGPFADHLGWYVAARVGCDGVGSCGGHQRLKEICEKNLEIFANKKNCPNQHRHRKKRK